MTRPLGAACSGYLADKISRKRTKCISGCVFVIGAILEATAQSSAWLIGARFVLGLAVVPPRSSLPSTSPSRRRPGFAVAR